MGTYQLSFCYPDGHVEEIDVEFYTLESAKEYGQTLLAQVSATEKIKKSSLGSKGKSYFTVSESDGSMRNKVFDSRD